VTGPGGQSRKSKSETGRAITIPAGDASTSSFVSAPSAEGALFVLAHGAGGSLADPLLVETHRELASRGHGVVRFNFLYRERGAKLPDKAPVCEATWRHVLGWVERRFPKHEGRVIIGGKSMGGRMASHLAASAGSEGGDALGGLFLLGYPLHPAKQPEKLRDEHLPRIKVRSFFAQGTNDALCNLALMRPRVKKMGPHAKLFVIDGADHSLDLPKRAGRSREDVVRGVVTEACAWLRA
jgi:predicted alpha/beta-hydrolase family hydrolase